MKFENYACILTNEPPSIFNKKEVLESIKSENYDKKNYKPLGDWLIMNIINTMKYEKYNYYYSIKYNSYYTLTDLKCMV